MSKAVKILLLMLSIALAVTALITGYDVGKKTTYPVAYSEYIVKYARENNLDVFLVMAVIKQESNFISDASSGYADGLMQLTEETAAWNAKQMGLTDYDYLDPQTNIMIGCHYLRFLIDTYKNTDTALAAYNGGMGNVDQWLSNSAYSSDGVVLDVIPFSETRAYVEKVNKYWHRYKQMYG